MTDPFDDIVAGLDIEEPDDVLDIRSLSDWDLVEMSANVRRELLDSDQMYGDLQESTAVATPEGRDLHSLRVALLVEMNRRGLR